jgi:O6-methylguanine-DNA--protein-cysteine methyltransferase
MYAMRRRWSPLSQHKLGDVTTYSKIIEKKHKITRQSKSNVSRCRHNKFSDDVK